MNEKATISVEVQLMCTESPQLITRVSDSSYRYSAFDKSPFHHVASSFIESIHAFIEQQDLGMQG